MTSAKPPVADWNSLSYEEIGAFVGEIGYDDYPAFARLALPGRNLPRRSGSIRNIAIFVYTLARGGIERVVSLWADEFHKRGYGVTVVTVEERSGNEYALPDGCKRVFFPGKREERWPAMRKLIEDGAIDCCLFNDHWSVDNYFDLVSAKLCGAYTVLTLHSTFFNPFYNGTPDIFMYRRHGSATLDALVNLTTGAHLTWRLLGYGQAVHIPNPTTSFGGPAPQATGCEKSVVLIARMSRLKGLFHLPAIIAGVAAKIPEVKFRLLGTFVSPDDEARFRRKISSLGLDRHVEIAGFVTNVSDYLSDSAVLIMPSYLEGYSMVRYEARLHGVPTVHFDMAYLDDLGEENGCVAVGKEDAEGMAAAVVRLLSDHEYWKKLSKNARENLPPGGTGKVMDDWETLFASIPRDSVAEDFAPSKQPDAAFAAMVLREFHISVDYANTLRHKREAELRRYDYLKPLDKVLAAVFPPGSRRRDFCARCAASVRSGLKKRRERRQARKHTKQEKKMSFLKRLFGRSRTKKQHAFTTSGEYWENRYQTGGTSGAGSYSRLADFKARVLNEFVAGENIRSVVEFGCGDGNQLSLAAYPEYLGVDVSPKAVGMCRRKFSSGPASAGTKRFVTLAEYTGEKAELALSLDVVFHLVEDAVFDGYMSNLFNAAEKHVVVYSSNKDGRAGDSAPHVRHRRFTDWVAEHRPDWEMTKHLPNQYPFNPDDPDNTSFADFYFFRRKDAAPQA